MYNISPFTPLFFAPTSDKFGARSKYVQTFAPTDRLLVQVVRTETEEEETTPVLTLSVKDILGGTETMQPWRSWSLNSETEVLWATIQGLPCGIYSVLVGTIESEPFCVTDDELLLAQTTLLQYSMRDNRQRSDTVFLIDMMRHFFDWRIPGGFKDDGWSFGVDNEQFTTNVYDVVDVYSHDVTLKTLTLGNSQGCPVWYAELLNRVLSCTYVYVDGVRYSRHESDVPEVNAEVEGLKSFIFKQVLQKVRILDPAVEAYNHLRIRRVVEGSTENFRGITDGDNMLQREIH